MHVLNIMGDEDVSWTIAKVCQVDGPVDRCIECAALLRAKVEHACRYEDDEGDDFTVVRREGGAGDTQ